MSLYNTLFDINSLTPVLLKCLGIAIEDIPRFRDCCIDKDRIIIYTRTGGSNRDYYENIERHLKNCGCNPDDDCNKIKWNADLRKNPNFMDDKDDDFDRTYAYFYYSFPPEYAEDLKALGAENNSYTPSEKWKLLISSLER